MKVIKAHQKDLSHNETADNEYISALRQLAGGNDTVGSNKTDQTTDSPKVESTATDKQTDDLLPVDAEHPSEDAPPSVFLSKEEGSGVEKENSGQKSVTEQGACRCDRACMKKCQLNWSITFGVGPF